MHKTRKKSTAILLSTIMFLIALPVHIFQGEENYTKDEVKYEKNSEFESEVYESETSDSETSSAFESEESIYETTIIETLFTPIVNDEYFILLTNRSNNWDGLIVLDSYVGFEYGDEMFIRGSVDIPSSWAAAMLNSDPTGHNQIAQGHDLTNANWHGGRFVFATSTEGLPGYAVSFDINPSNITSGIRIQTAGSGEGLNLRIYEIIVKRDGNPIFDLASYLQDNAIENINDIDGLQASGANVTIVRPGTIIDDERFTAFDLETWLTHAPGTVLPWTNDAVVRHAGSTLIVGPNNSVYITERSADWGGMDVRVPLYPGDRIEIEGHMSSGNIRLQRLPGYSNLTVQSVNADGSFVAYHIVTEAESLASDGFRINSAEGSHTITIHSITINRLEDAEQPEEPEVIIPPVDLPVLNPAYLGNYVLRTYIAAGVQWDGIRIPRTAFASYLTPSGHYTFSVDISTPRSPQGVGLMLQTNGPRWGHLVTTPNYHPDEEIFFSRFTSAPWQLLNYDFTELQLVKLGDGSGGVFPNSRVLFFIDNFTIRNADGNIVWEQNFEDGSSTPFNMSGPAGSYVQVVRAEEAFTAELPVQIVNYWDLTLPSLLEALSDHFLVGNVWPTRAPQMMDQNTESFFLRNFNAITAEDAHKPDVIAPSPGTWNFTYADQIVDWAEANNVKMVGHTLVWHSQSPLWMTGREGHATLPLVTRAQAKENMHTFISTYAGRYSGRMYSWDVLNEIFVDFISGPAWDANPDWRAHMRREGTGLNNLNYLRWYDAFANGATGDECGSDFIFYAFYFARKYDPHAVLYYNDFNEEAPGKREAIAAMVEEINERWRNHPSYDNRLLIERIGMQSHHHLDQWPTNFDNIRPAIMRFIETGAGISITELDITIGTQGPNQPRELTDAEQERLAAAYARVFGYYLEFADYIYRLSIWGLTDAQSWRAWGNPLLFDAELQPKEAFWAVINAIPNDPSIPPSNERPSLIIVEYVYYYECEITGLPTVPATPIDPDDQGDVTEEAPRRILVRREINLGTLTNAQLRILRNRGTITQEQFNLAMRSRIERFWPKNPLE
ncbi:MAG: endo-1,4-beta-xylanase [Defluviitaleaceae bacterium]|nr:endo-1,4-beta-xylanase [Defluviitaleaceae bacterium]